MQSLETAPTDVQRLVTGFSYVPFREEDFSAKGPRTYLKYRDLGLRQVSGGLIHAEHLRVLGNEGGATGWHSHELDFQLVYVLKGSAVVGTEDGLTRTLRAGDCLHVPAFYRHNEISCSPDYEVLQILAPADIKTYPDEKRPARVDQVAGRTSEFSLAVDSPDSYKVGEGVRQFLAYRDPGVAKATGGRVGVNVVRNSKAGDSSTGWHWHSLSCQFVFVLQGWARVAVEGEGEFVMHPFDAMTIPRGLKHDVTGFSADFTTLELNIPAVFETFNCPPPASR